MLGYLLVGLLLLHLGVQGQTPSEIAGHYPLKVEYVSPDVSYAKFTLVKPYDVSINGNHGTTYTADGQTSFTENGQVKSADSKFVKGSFPYPSSSGIKASKSGYMTFRHDPYLHHDLSAGFSMVCWVLKGSKGTIFRTAHFQARVEADIFKFDYWHGSTAYTVAPSGWALDDGWNMITLTVDGDHLYTAYKNGLQAEQASLQGAPEISSGSTPIRLIDVSFKGEVAHVMFVTRHMIDAEVTRMKSVIESNEASQDHYVVRGRFSHFPLDSDNNLNETVLDRDALAVTGASATANRNGEAGKAIAFTGTNAHMSLNNFFSDSYHPQRGVTISFWMKKEAAESTPQGGIQLPFTQQDARHKLFYGDDDIGQTLFGMQRVKDRMGTLTYLAKDNSSVLPWYNWFYDPVSFRDKAGWYHVIYVQHEYWTRVYIASSSESVNCGCAAGDWDCWRGCQMHYDYYSFQPLTDVRHWGIGNRSGLAHSIMDDFSIYKWPLDIAEVTMLHDIERGATSQTRNATAQEQPFSADIGILANPMLVYPNPTSDKVLVSLPDAMKGDQIQVVVTDLNGRVWLKKEITSMTQKQFEVDLSYLSSGVYHLKVESAIGAASQKVIVN